MAYDITLISKLGYTKAQINSAILTLQSEILADGDAVVNSLTTPALSISFGQGGPLRTELLRAWRYAAYVKDPLNTDLQDARIIREQTAIVT